MFFREHAAGGFCEGGHGGVRYAGGDDFAEGGVVDDGEIEGVGEGDGGTALALGTVAGGAIIGIQRGEVGDVVGGDGGGVGGGLAGRSIAASDKQRGEEGSGENNAA